MLAGRAGADLQEGSHLHVFLMFIFQTSGYRVRPHREHICREKWLQQQLPESSAWTEANGGK